MLELLENTSVSQPIGDLIRHLRLERDMTLRDLGAKVGISHSVLSKKELGDIKVAPAERKRFAKAFGMTEDEFNALWMPGSASPPPYGIPVVNRAPAGDVIDYNHDQGAAAEYHDPWQFIDRGMVSDPDAYAVIVVGDSMEPGFREGDHIIFTPVVEGRPSRQPKPGQVVFIRFSGESKHVGCCLARWRPMEDGSWLLAKDNPAYRPKKVRPEEVARMGIFVEHRKRWS